MEYVQYDHYGINDLAGIGYKTMAEAYDSYQPKSVHWCYCYSVSDRPGNNDGILMTMKMDSGFGNQLYFENYKKIFFRNRVSGVFNDWVEFGDKTHLKRDYKVFRTVIIPENKYFTELDPPNASTDYVFITLADWSSEFRGSVSVAGYAQYCYISASISGTIDYVALNFWYYV